MPTSLLLALAVSAGVAAGVCLDPATLWPARWLTAIFGVSAFLFAARGMAAIATALGACALAAVCALLGADAQHRALHPPLRAVLEQHLGGFAIDALGIERHDAPYEIEGRLLADGTITWPLRSASSPVFRFLRYQPVWNGCSSQSPFNRCTSSCIVCLPSFVPCPSRRGHCRADAAGCRGQRHLAPDVHRTSLCRRACIAGMALARAIAG